MTPFALLPLLLLLLTPSATSVVIDSPNALVELDASEESGGDPPAPKCQGLIEEMCDPCPKDGPDEFCTTTFDMCAEIFCRPMCLRNTWSCEVDFGGLTLEAGDPSYQQALCAQFLAQGCQSVLDCCALDEKLEDYTGNNMYADQYPDPRMPSPSCLQGPSDELCDKCTSEVKVTLEALECQYPTPEGEPDAEPQDTAVASDAEGNDFPGENAHKGLQQRCLKLLEKVEGELSSMKSDFEENACKCMGCCKGECFYPVTEEFKPDGWEAESSSS